MNPLDDPETIVKIRACTATNTAKSSTKQIQEAPAAVGVSILSAQSAWWSPPVEKQHVSASIEKIQARALSIDTSSDQGNIFFSYLNGTVVGIYTGALVDVDSTISALSVAASSSLELTEASRNIIQVCGGNRTSDYTIGLVSSSDGNLVFVQRAVKSWAKASCAAISGASGTKDIDHLDITTRLLGYPSSHSKRHSHPHSSNKKLCSTLMEGQVVCCSSGSLPDIRPKPKANGECATHDVDGLERVQESIAGAEDMYEQREPSITSTSFERPVWTDEARNQDANWWQKAC
ncbi:hypothetical protein J7337_010409 [Fusarium musae]|uniref:Uncharacterized protein n=1 Tax=Fusarium musae TaxID=1042133 RepID=A0A9P8D931_9HYPO|nr:hypothetical protein J7337_010409 [Fusarium musae]KAG9497548.1 hypothetical protein J7337_010409 [Fusarium musae]